MLQTPCQSFFLRSGNNVPLNLYQTNVILCAVKKVQGPKAQPFPSEVQVLTEGPPLVTPSGTGPQTLPSCSSLREPGVQDPTCLQAPQATQMKAAAAIRSRDRDRGEILCCLKAWAKASGRPWRAGELEGSERPGSVSYLTLHLKTTTPSTIG